MEFIINLVTFGSHHHYHFLPPAMPIGLMEVLNVLFSFKKIMYFIMTLNI